MVQNILIGSQVVVSVAARTKMLEQLHQGQPGITRMKGLARSLCGGQVWTNNYIEQKEKLCSSCQQHQNTSAPLHPWEWPKRPNWARLDYAGPFLGS